MSRAKKMKCQCGCGHEDWSSRMTTVEVEQAKDRTMREVESRQTFRVTRRCAKPFEEELKFQKALQMLVRAWRSKPNSGCRFWRWPLTFRDWLRRIMVARQVMRLNHAIHERPKKILLGEREGFEWTRQHSIRTAVLFGCPKFLQGFMVRRFTLKAKRKAARDAARAPVIVTSEPVKA